jgi:hypothetical protein
MSAPSFESERTDAGEQTLVPGVRPVGTRERLERLMAVPRGAGYEQEHTASQLAAAGFDAFGISNTFAEMERRHHAMRLARETFDGLKSEEADRLRFLQDIRLFDRTMFEGEISRRMV